MGTAIEINSESIRNEWDAYDLKTSNGIKIEVKSAAYIQSWNQKKFSNISFSIKPSRYWDAETNIQQNESKRHADVYVFCLLNHKEQSTINPLNMEQWEFYIAPTSLLNNYPRSQSSITLNSLKKLSEAVEYDNLANEIDRVFKKQKTNFI